MLKYFLSKKFRFSVHVLKKILFNGNYNCRDSATLKFPRARARLNIKF